MNAVTVSKGLICLCTMIAMGSPVFGVNPMGMAFFAAAYKRGIWRGVLLPGAIGVLFYAMSPIAAAKYSFWVISYAIIISVYEMLKRILGVQGSVGAVANFVIVGILSGLMETSEFFFLSPDIVYWGYAIGIGLLTAGFLYFFQVFIDMILCPIRFQWMNNEEMIAVSLFCGVMLCFLQRIEMVPRGVLFALAVLLVCILGKKQGVGLGAVAGSLMGVALWIATGDFEMVAIYSLLGIVSGFIVRLLGKRHNKMEVIETESLDYRENEPRIVSNFVESVRSLTAILKRAEPMEEDGMMYVFDQGVVACRDCGVLDYNRFRTIMNRRLQEGRRAMAEGMEELSYLMEECVEKEKLRWLIPKEGQDRLREGFLNEGILLKKIVARARRDGRKQLILFMGNDGKRNISIRNCAMLCSQLLEMEFEPEENNPSFLQNQPIWVALREATNFRLQYGVSYRKRRGERASGDSFCYIPVAGGKVLFGLSDGAGTGELAKQESESLLEIMEGFMENGFSFSHGISLLNATMAGLLERQATADFGMIDLYQGVCHFAKAGAAPTYIRRDGRVEKIVGKTLPIGVLDQVKLEENVRKLYHGDYIIMCTDGVFDGALRDEQEAELVDFLMAWKGTNLEDFAKSLLDFSNHFRDNIRDNDDAMVFVAALWEKN